MKRFYIYTICSFLNLFSVLATHNRAGEITFRHISGLTYEFTITTYTYTRSQANRSYLTIEWGDNTSDIAYMDPGFPILLPNEYRHNQYSVSHTFPGPAQYKVLVQDPNRNLGVQNIPNSVNVIFSIETVFVINSFIGENNSPVLLYPPKDKAALGHRFIHNPAAYDPDGDSISYKLSVCTGQDGIPIANYSYPDASDTLYIDPLSGDLVWDAPTDTGKFNIAMNIEEWRKGIRIGNIVRDMQIEVFRTDNNPPVNPETFQLCVEAGDSLEFTFITLDADNDRIVQEFFSGIFDLENSPATEHLDSSGYGYSVMKVKWATTCDHVRNQPYQLTLKSEDINADISLVDIDNYYIKVISPPVKNLNAASTSSSISVTWDMAECEKVNGYAIYRSDGNNDFFPDSCQTGVPDSSGFFRIGTVSGRNATQYIDELNLVQGIEFCYIVTALFPDGSESYASEKICAFLIPGMPALTNVSVLVNDNINGKIKVAWVKPDPDTISAPGPYVYQIFRSQSPDIPFAIIDSIETIDLSDTVYIDSLINTAGIYPYYYSVKLINNTPGNRFNIGEENIEVASSLYAGIVPEDNRLRLNFIKKVPWVNTEYTIYKQNPVTLEFDSLDVTSNGFYVDSLLNNGTQYCYRLRSRGWRPFDSLIYTNENLSHITCGIPQDLVAPCPPVLTAHSLCDSSRNILTWTNPNNTCADDVIRYDIYYSPSLEGTMDSLASTYNAVDTIYIHQLPDNVQLAGCYSVKAVDSAENKSSFSEKVCVDECYLYEIPNVFTPNSDGENDFFAAYNRNNAVKQIKLTVFNRWGQPVYESTDPDFKWDGKVNNTDKIAQSGVYYYICDVYEPRLGGIFVRNLSGFVHIFAESGKKGTPSEF